MKRNVWKRVDTTKSIHVTCKIVRVLPDRLGRRAEAAAVPTENIAPCLLQSCRSLVPKMTLSRACLDKLIRVFWTQTETPEAKETKRKKIWWACSFAQGHPPQSVAQVLKQLPCRLRVLRDRPFQTQTHTFKTKTSCSLSWQILKLPRPEPVLANLQLNNWRWMISASCFKTNHNTFKSYR